jgi:hypothetical protein
MKGKCLIIQFVAVLVALPLTSSAQSVRFVKDWETSIPLHTSLGGVCVDKSGNVQLITTDGLWATLDASGKIMRETREDMLQGASRVACLLQNQIVVAVPPHTLHIFSGDHQLLASLPVEDGIRAVLSADDESIRLFAPHQGHLFEDVERKTGAMVSPLGPRSQSLIPPGWVPGEAAADDERGLLLFLTHNPETVSVWDSTGKLLLSKPITSNIRPRDESQSSDIPGAPISHDQALGIFPLGGDRYLVNVSLEDVAPDRRSIMAQLRYQILDGRFNSIGYASGDFIGVIHASDSHGGIYSVNGGHRPRVVKAHLQ